MRVRLRRRQRGERQRPLKGREPADRIDGRIRRAVAAEGPQLDARLLPVVGRDLQPRLVERAPPEHRAAVGVPGIPEHRAHVVGDVALRRLFLAARTVLLDERRLPGDVRENARHGGRIRRGADAAEVVLVLRAPEVVGMHRHPVRKQGVHLGRPRAVGRQLQAVDADDRPRRIGAADDVVDIALPELGALLARDVTENPRLVARLPRGDRPLALQARDEALQVARLPLERVGVGVRIQMDEGRGNVVAERHLPREQRHDEAKAMLLREVAELLKARDHPLVHARASARRVGKRLLAEEQARLADDVPLAGGQGDGHDRLEVRPVREDAQDGQAGFLERDEILFDFRRIPLRPHLRRRMARPVVRADRQLSGRKQRLRPGSDRMRLRFGQQGRQTRDRGDRQIPDAALPQLLAETFLHCASFLLLELCAGKNITLRASRQRLNVLFANTFRRNPRERQLIGAEQAGGGEFQLPA